MSRQTKNRLFPELTAKERESSKKSNQQDGVHLYHCPFQNLELLAGVAPASINMILTDVPYDWEFLPQASEPSRRKRSVR